MKVRRVLVAAGVLAVATAAVAAPGSRAHTGASFCESTFVAEGHGPVRPDGTQPGHAAGSCETGFQGEPVGVIGVYDAGDSTLPAEIHVEAWAVTANGTKLKLAECESVGTGTATCEAEENQLGQSMTLPEPLPTQIVRIECLAHSHAAVKVGAAPVGRFGCYSTDEAEAALREDMGVPADEGPPSEEATAEEPAAEEGSVAGGVTQLVTTVPRDTYAPSTVLVSRGGGLTYANLDLNRHDLVARVYDDDHDVREDHVRPDDSAPWCEDFFGDCPLFWSELIQGPAASTPVLGLEDAEVGATYEFYCSIHPYMRGTLTVVE